tara:strand:- start:2359 stop:3252 length:894 start_codon:yes stop_codon:yes gene_type:complete
MKITETCILEDRGIIYIEGQDAKDFLQNIITNDINKVSESQSIYGSLLTPQGKYLFDFIVAKHKKGYLLDCSKDELGDLIKTLNLYKLRSKLEILDLSNEFVIAAISLEKFLTLDKNISVGNTIKHREDTILLDPRNIRLGARLISNLEKLYLSLKKLNLTIINKELYYRESFELGIVQNNNLKLQNKLFGVECNFEELNAIDFKKGCFVGQENTSRIKLRNKLKRRLLPIKVINGKVLENELIKFNNIEIGRVLIENPFPFGIVKIIDPDIDEFLNKDLICGTAKLKIFVPKWLKI